MKVREIMSGHVTVCAPDTDLAEATRLLWQQDCGVLPVVENGKLCGIITDRDMCVALGTRNRPASDIKVREVATRDVGSCSPDTDLDALMGMMRRERVRRVPVVNDEGTVIGMIGVNDLVLAAGRNRVRHEDVLETLKAISEHRVQRIEAKPPAKAKAAPAAVAAGAN